jgi:hypothetical protein
VLPGPPGSPETPPPWTWADTLAIALLVGCLVALFWKPLFTSSRLFYRDIYNYTYPIARLIRASCRQGVLPYWNPFLNYGQPLLANPNYLFFYPYTALIILLPLKIAYTLFYVFHFALAGVGTYLLARRWRQSRSAAFLAAFIFTFSGPVLSLGNLYNHAACAAWIPWALLMTDRALESRSVRPWLLLTLVFALQFLAAEPFTMMATFGLSLAYALFQRGTHRPLLSSANLRILSGFFLVGSLMVALCAIQFLPAADLLEQARRGTTGLSFRETTRWSFHPLSMLDLIAPGFFGSTVTSPSGWITILGNDSGPYFVTVFVGCIPFFLALAGWALSGETRRRFVAGAALVLWLLSLGNFTPVFSLAYLMVPLLALVRFPIKMLVPVILLVALLAGWGLDALRQDPAGWRDRSRRVLLPLKVLLILVAAVWLVTWVAPGVITLPTQWVLTATKPKAKGIADMLEYLLMAIRVYFPGLAGFILAGIVCVLGLGRDRSWARPGLMLLALFGMVRLVSANYSANPTVPRSFYAFRPPVLAHLEGSPDSYRVASLVRYTNPQDRKNDLQSYVNFESIPAAAGMPGVALGAFQDRLLLNTGSMLNGVEEGLNVDVERSLPPYLYDLWIYLIGQAPSPPFFDRVLGRTNVKYLVRRSRLDASTRRLVWTIPNGSPAPSYLYEDLCLMPRAYVAGSSVFTGSSLATLRRMASADFDLRNHVILAAEPHSSPDVQDAGEAGHVKIVARPPNEVILRAELASPAYVVLLDRYDPNWHASLDGREVPVLRANQIFRAVYAPAGQHDIRFYYRQRGLLAGLIISLLALALAAGLYAFNPRVPGC